MTLSRIFAKVEEFAGVRVLSIAAFVFEPLRFSVDTIVVAAWGINENPVTASDGELSPRTVVDRCLANGIL